MRVLVTGGAGFIGSHIVENLLQSMPAAAPVRVLDNLSTGRRTNLEPFGKRVEWIEGDIRDAATLAKAMRDVDLVFHLAAMISVQQSIEQPLVCQEINAAGTIGVLQSAREAGVKRVIFSSTSAIYGENPVTPKHETLAPDCLSPYAATKLAGEFYCQLFSKLYGLDTVCFRYFNVFGPRQDPNSPYAAVIPKFIEAIESGLPPNVHGDGEQTRDFISVRDVARANRIAALHPDPLRGEVFNVGTGQSLSLNRLLEVFGRLLGRDPKAVYGPPKPGDIKHSLADVTRIRERLGFQADIGLEAGLAETLNNFGYIKPKR